MGSIMHKYTSRGAFKGFGLNLRPGQTLMVQKGSDLDLTISQHRAFDGPVVELSVETMDLAGSLDRVTAEADGLRRQLADRDRAEAGLRRQLGELNTRVDALLRQPGDRGPSHAVLEQQVLQLQGQLNSMSEALSAEQNRAAQLLRSFNAEREAVRLLHAEIEALQSNIGADTDEPAEPDAVAVGTDAAPRRKRKGHKDTK